VRQTGLGRASAVSTTKAALPALLVVLAFLWGRKRTRALIEWSKARLVATERPGEPSLALRTVRVLGHVHRPLEWIALSLALFWLLPPRAEELLEVKLLFLIVRWTLACSLVVNIVNALASAGDGAAQPAETSEVATLRLRSLRLVAWTFLAFALILILSARLVGKGTIHSWVFSTCWFAAIPVFFLLVRWWRGVVFDRIGRLRRKTPLQIWVLAHRSGWQSFLAAMSGAVQLFTIGALKLASNWLASFDLVRRVHAYLYKRELERSGTAKALAEFVPLRQEALEKLHPERPFETWLPCPARSLKDSLTAQALSRQGGVVAVVAARGMGKSALLRTLGDQVPDAAVLTCHPELDTGGLQTLCERDPSLVLLDDAHTLVQPHIGGLAKFDEVATFARAHAEKATWVLTIDASVWPLLKRARDAQPIFDSAHILSPWDEGQIGALIRQRCYLAEIDPVYDSLVDRLPPGADELDRKDAAEEKRAGYQRMLWDHVGGNPGLALQAWRMSLGEDSRGTVHVRPLRVPDIARLERLSDSSLFVLRAVLQLAPTNPETVAQATRLRLEQVLADLRFGRAQGFYDEQDGQVRIAWSWLRSVSRLLERRHLLVSL
jgi:hypothetical protein